MNRRTLLKSLAALCATPLAKPAVSGDVVHTDVHDANLTIHYPKGQTWMASGFYQTPNGPLEVGDGVIVHASNECLGGCVCGAQPQQFPPERLVVKPEVL